MLYIDLLKYTRAIYFYTLKPQKQGACKTIHNTIVQFLAFLARQSEMVKISPNRSYLPLKRWKISIFEPFTGGGTYAQRAVQVLDFRPMLVFLDTKFKFRTYVPRFSDHHISLTRFSDQSFFLIYIRFSATPIFIFLNKFIKFC